MTAPHPALPLVALALPSLLMVIRSRRIGPGVYTFGSSDSAHDLQGWLFRMVVRGLGGFFLLRLIWPEVTEFAGPVPWLANAPAAWGGLAVLMLGSAVAVAGQWQMGASWRVGLGREATGLVTNGLFALSRNPVFVGFVLVLIGCFLTDANAVTATLAGIGWAAMATQTRLEEAHLTATQGEDYQAYCAQVRRWL